MEWWHLCVQVQQLKQREANLEANIKKFLNADQIDKLKREWVSELVWPNTREIFFGHQPTHKLCKVETKEKQKKPKQLPDQKDYNIIWLSETIQWCLGIQSVVGRNGYEYLWQMNYPLLSYCTLCRHTENCTFTPGIQRDVLQWPQVKMSTAKESEKLCVLLVDEMLLKSCTGFDTFVKEFREPLVESAVSSWVTQIWAYLERVLWCKLSSLKFHGHLVCFHI